MTYQHNGRILESRLAPKSTGYENYLYTLHDEPLVRNPAPDIIETRIFQPIDTEGEKAHRRLLAEGVAALTGPERRAWSLFLNAMLHRAPHRLHKDDMLATKLAEQVIRDMESQASDKASYRRIRMVTKLINPSAAGKNVVRRHMLKAMSDQATLAQIEAMWWVLFDMPSELELYTSSRPFLVNAGRQAAPLVFAWIPISPRKLFALFPASFRLEGDPQSKDEVRDIFKLAALFHNVLLLQERPERLYSRDSIRGDLRGHLLDFLTPVEQ